MCDPTTEHLLSWEPLDDFYGSDHLPLEISIQRNIPYAQPQRSNRTLESSRNESIKKVFWSRSRRRRVPWWNERCELSNRNCKHADNRLKKYFTVEDSCRIQEIHVEYKKSRKRS
ncbi:hypothetical protein WA026_019510 [Henosepilachna vigintioctopunctata]|uniref:Endonuclease/exonuclease/phosphatase domain-containing protein n=1 Tax=Henosepilachna vigintioctopunctata TaxID=420089 RepID=A0AAW1U041_9CUCU